MSALMARGQDYQRESGQQVPLVHRKLPEELGQNRVDRARSTERAAFAARHCSQSS